MRRVPQIIAKLFKPLVLCLNSSAHGIIEIPESVVGSPERNIARIIHHELAPGRDDIETTLQTCSLLILQVPANDFVLAPPLLQTYLSLNLSKIKNELVFADA